MMQPRANSLSTKMTASTIARASRPRTRIQLYQDHSGSAICAAGLSALIAVGDRLEEADGDQAHDDADPVPAFLELTDGGRDRRPGERVLNALGERGQELDQQDQSHDRTPESVAAPLDRLDWPVQAPAPFQDQEPRLGRPPGAFWARGASWFSAMPRCRSLRLLRTHAANSTRLKRPQQAERPSLDAIPFRRNAAPRHWCSYPKTEGTEERIGSSDSPDAIMVRAG